MIWSRDLVTWHDIQPHQSNSTKVMNSAHPKTPPSSDLYLIYDLCLIYNIRLIYNLYLRIDLLSISSCQRFICRKSPSYALIPKDLDKQSFFIVNGNKAGRYHPRLINNKACKGYPGSTSQWKCWRVPSLYYYWKNHIQVVELASIIFALSMELLVGVIFQPLLKASYGFVAARKLYCLAWPTHLGLLAPIS